MKVSAYKRIAFFCPYPYDSAPGQRFRYEQYLSMLKDNGYEYEIFPFLDEKSNVILYKKGAYMAKVFGIAKGFLARLIHIYRIKNVDYVFLFREAAPIGPPIFEWIISKVLRKKIIYDFDDAIWLPYISQENRIVFNLKWFSKIKSICKWSYKISCGNAYLCEYAFQYNKNVVCNPTTIDTINYHNQLKNQDTSETVIGWTGSHSTLKYLDMLIPVLRRLEKDHCFTFLVIADNNPHIPLKSFSFKKWNKESEISDLLNFNIGVMPLWNDAWAKGKCGFKALQYLSVGIPALVSPVGVNNKIIEEGINGFICDSEDEWVEKLSLLIQNKNLRTSLGIASRETVNKKYSVASNAKNFLDLFD